MISTEAKRIKSCNPVTFPVPASSSPIVVADDKSTINKNVFHLLDHWGVPVKAVKYSDDMYKKNDIAFRW